MCVFWRKLKNLEGIHMNMGKTYKATQLQPKVNGMTDSSTACYEEINTSRQVIDGKRHLSLFEGKRVWLKGEQDRTVHEKWVAASGSPA